jgi:hypothetical protein
MSSLVDFDSLIGNCQFFVQGEMVEDPIVISNFW